jgi:hypothetical protein
VEAQLVTRRRKKRRRRDEVVRRQPGKGHKNKVPGIYNRAAYRAERVRLMQHWSDRPRLGQLGFEAALFGRNAGTAKKRLPLRHFGGDEGIRCLGSGVFRDRFRN